LNRPVHPSETRQLVHAEMLAMIEGLVAEYAGRVPASTVMRCVARSREHLLQTGVRDGLVAATEAAVRVRLAAQLPARSFA
jgi:hypothetical protein